MSDIRVPRYEANEIAKQEDFDFGNDIEYANLSIILNELFAKSTNDIIVNGLSCQQRGTPSMNVDLTKGLSYCISTGKLAHSGSLFGPISITNGGAQNRIDTLEIRLLETDYDQQQRAFKDPVTGNITYQDIYTKTRFEMEAQIINGTEGAGVAPNHTSGWIKIAEINVDAGESTSILNADIENCTGGYDTQTTANWTAETAITFRMGNASNLKTLFRTSHDEDGDHTDNIIDTQHLATDAVETAKIKNEAVETAKIKNENVTLAKIARGTLDTYLKAQGASDPIYEKLALKDTGIKIGNGTRNTAGDQVITGVGFESSVIIFIAGDADSVLNFSNSWGFDNGTVHMCQMVRDDGVSQLINTGFSIFIETTGDILKGLISAIGADGYTITWTLTGTKSVNFIYLCLP